MERLATTYLIGFTFHETLKLIQNQEAIHNKISICFVWKIEEELEVNKKWKNLEMEKASYSTK